MILKTVFIALFTFISTSAFSLTGFEEVEICQENIFAFQPSDKALSCEEKEEIRDSLFNSKMTVIGIGVASVLCPEPVTKVVATVAGITVGGIEVIDFFLNKIDCTEEIKPELERPDAILVSRKLCDKLGGFYVAPQGGDEHFGECWGPIGD